jgi:hypothetical protein
MPDETPTNPPELPVDPANETGSVAPPPIPFDIGEEFGTAKKNLPPVKILILSVIAIAIIGAAYSFLERAHSSAAGAIDNIASVEIPNQNAVMVAITVSFQNHGEKPFWIHTMGAELETPTGSFKDDAASGADFERYFQAFPSLKQNSLPALKLEDKIEPGGSAKGTVIVSFPVTQDVFNARKSLKVSIWAYDQGAPLVLSK